ncbi:hypothetical protein [Veiled chameleon serpentovirus A]|uniref:Uncharacterized protein n=1 Tax=Veiled chameleon serpentovirus A TaxID=2806429 RepID=A0AAE7P8K9_9NIDO|nr:hypothetical protein QKS92_gp09 [Veiled chameleon serpentovirus A]QRC47055.1 hypothetical protein [Veiled chameleon serpentovirus A]
MRQRPYASVERYAVIPSNNEGVSPQSRVLYMSKQYVPPIWRDCHHLQRRSVVFVQPGKLFYPSKGGFCLHQLFKVNPRGQLETKERPSMPCLSFSPPQGRFF